MADFQLVKKALKNGRRQSNFTQSGNRYTNKGGKFIKETVKIQE